MACQRVGGEKDPGRCRQAASAEGLCAFEFGSQRSLDESTLFTAECSLDGSTHVNGQCSLELEQNCKLKDRTTVRVRRCTPFRFRASFADVAPPIHIPLGRSPWGRVGSFLPGP